MSPLLRRATRSSFRPRRSLRTFRTQWVGIAGGTGVLPPDTSIILPLLTNVQTTSLGLNQPTILRIRGELVGTFNGAEAPPVQATPWIGMAVFDTEDTEPGGNPDDPFTDAGTAQWMYHRVVYLWSATTDPQDPRLVTTAAVRFEVDVKSRRRITNGTALAMVVSNVPIANPASIGFAITGRVLLHEFGR